MNLRDLVGRMAIRTDKVREVMPWEMERAFRLDFMVPVPIFDREKYMDEPVRILAVEGTQVVIEEDGKRKLLERRYIDERWTDYERLLHPEEEEKEKAEKLMKEFEVAAETIKHFLAVLMPRSDYGGDLHGQHPDFQRRTGRADSEYLLPVRSRG